MSEEEINLGVDAENGDNGTVNNNDVNNNEDSTTTTTTTTSSSPAHPTLSARQQRLFEIRLKLNAIRKQNHEEVVDEDQQSKETPSGNARKRRIVKKEKYEAENEKITASGLDPEREWYLNMTAEEAEQRSKKNKKKGNTSDVIGWDAFGEEAQHNIYKRRIREVDNSKKGVSTKDEYKQAVSGKKEDDLDGSVDSLNYGITPQVPKENVDRMVSELKKNAEKAGNFSRRRPHYEDADVTFINERNRIFNKKIARAYDPYTAEIRANFERGTAL